MGRILLLIVLLCCVNGASANEAPLPELFRAAAKEFNIPVEVTQAIAAVESEHQPYRLNVAGQQSMAFESKQDAMEAAGRALSRGQSFDSGIMQINSQWLKKYHLPLAAIFDPAANIYLGAWILAKNLREHGGQLWKAVAAYHSPDPWRGNQYVAMVKAALARKSLTSEKQPRIALQPLVVRESGQELALDQ